MDQSSTISNGETRFGVQKIWNICLDAKADRALHELEMREQEASVASLRQTCQKPRLIASTSTFAWTMECSGRSPVDGTPGKADIKHITTFVSDKETQAETIIVNGDPLIQREGRFLTRMKNVGACVGGLKPGDMTLVHWRINGDETLENRQRRTVHDEIANLKALTTTRLAR